MTIDGTAESKTTGGTDADKTSASGATPTRAGQGSRNASAGAATAAKSSPAAAASAASSADKTGATSKTSTTAKAETAAAKPDTTKAGAASASKTTPSAAAASSSTSPASKATDLSSRKAKPATGSTPERTPATTSSTTSTTPPARTASNDNSGSSPWLAGLVGAAAALAGVWLLGLFGVFGGDDDVAQMRAEIAELRAQSEQEDAQAVIVAMDERLAQLEAASGTLTDTGGITAEVEARIDERIAEVQAALSGSTAEGSDALGALATIEERIGRLEEGGAAAQGVDLSATEGRIAQIEEALGAGDGEAREALNALQARLDEIATAQQARIEALSGDFEGVQTGVTGVVATIASVRDRVDALRDDLARIEATGAETGTALLSTGEQIEVVAGDVTTVRDRVETLRTDIERLTGGAARTSQRIDQIASTVTTNGTRLDDIAGRMDDLSGRTDEIASRVDTNAGQLAELSATVEESRSDTVIARAIAASNLRTAIDRGTSFTRELENYATVAEDVEAVAPLRDFAGRGVPTVPELLENFPDTARAIMATEIEVGEDAGVVDQIFGSARNLVSVRPVGSTEGNDTGAIVSRMEDALSQSDLERVLSEAAALDEEATVAAAPFLQDVRARQVANSLIDNALARAMRPAG